jgi:hypothetical protein
MDGKVENLDRQFGRIDWAGAAAIRLKSGSVWCSFN